MVFLKKISFFIFKIAAYGFLAILLVSLIILGIIFVFPEGKKEKTVFGVSFSPAQAENLGVSPREVFSAVLDDLKIKNFRLASYWDRTEPEKGSFFWDELDWQINEVKKREGRIILVVGRKQFRWPECHVPEWAGRLPISKQREEVLNFIEETVERYKDEKTVWAWQVENEPLFPFGKCPERDRVFLDAEIKKVREIDPSRPIIITDSGEFSTWISSAKRADIFGTTLYKIVKNRLVPGYLSYEFIPSSFYRKKAAIVKWLFPSLKDVIVIELQGEPWDLLKKKDYLEGQFKTMDFERFKRTIRYSEDVGYKESYLWGVEWWYWMKSQKQHPEFWEFVKTLNL